MAKNHCRHNVKLPNLHEDNENNKNNNHKADSLELTRVPQPKIVVTQMGH